MALQSVLEKATGGYEATGMSHTVELLISSTTNDETELEPTAIIKAASNRMIPKFDSTYGVDHDGFIWPTELAVAGESSKCTNIRYTDMFVHKFTNGDELCTRRFTCEFKNKALNASGGNQGGAPPGEDPETNPLEWEPRISERSVSRQEIAERLKFLGAYQLADSDETTCNPCTADSLSLESVNNYPVHAMTKDKCSAVTNTLGEPFQNPPQVKKFDKEITIIVNVADVNDNDALDCHEGSLNVDEFVIESVNQGYSRTCDVHEAWLTEIQHERKERTYLDSGGDEQTVQYWERRYVILRRKGGWNLDILNTGMNRRAIVGDDNGMGGTYGAGDVGPGIQQMVPIKGPDGFSLSGPSTITKAGDVAQSEIWYLRWLASHETAFLDDALGLNANGADVIKAPTP